LFIPVYPAESTQNQNHSRPVKKLSAILLLISTFTFSQWARQLSYLECKFFNAFRTETAKCDCEKLAGLDKEDTGQPSPALHYHFHPDEFFFPGKKIAITPVFKLLRHPLHTHTGVDELKGHHPGPWRPPNS